MFGFYIKLRVTAYMLSNVQRQAALMSAGVAGVYFTKSVQTFRRFAEIFELNKCCICWTGRTSEIEEKKKNLWNIQGENVIYFSESLKRIISFGCASDSSCVSLPSWFKKRFSSWSGVDSPALQDSNFLFTFLLFFYLTKSNNDHKMLNGTEKHERRRVRTLNAKNLNEQTIYYSYLSVSLLKSS